MLGRSRRSGGVQPPRRKVVERATSGGEDAGGSRDWIQRKVGHTGCTMRSLRHSRQLWASREGLIAAPRVTYPEWLRTAAMLQRRKVAARALNEFVEPRFQKLEQRGPLIRFPQFSDFGQIVVVENDDESLPIQRGVSTALNKEVLVLE
jgi:hypothetical protein